MGWFTEDRFGMFIHFGAYSAASFDPWLRSIKKLSIKEYQPYVDAFLPRPGSMDAWAEKAAEAGMRYAVLTARHHDGFCLFDSKLSDYSTMHTECGRDLVAEFVTAFRKRGIKIGLYYSLIDWHHPDYPHFGDAHHPMRDNPDYRDHKPNLPRYLEFMHGQVRELFSNYGDIDIAWFDFSYGEMSGEGWRAADLVRMVRDLQPGVIINNRLETSGGGLGSIVTPQRTDFSGDFVSPEQLVPAAGIRDFAGKLVSWESNLTINNNWGYNSEDNFWKAPATIIRKLVECVSKGGNMLLGAGPDAQGNLPAEAISVLSAIGAWMRVNGESIYGCGVADLERPEWGYYTQRGDTLYAHVLHQPIGPMALTGGLRKTDIGQVTRLADGHRAEISKDWITDAYPDLPFLSMGSVGHHTYPLFDPVDTVYKIGVKGAQ